MEMKNTDNAAHKDELPMEPQLAEVSLRDYRNSNQLKSLGKDFSLPRKKRNVVDTLKDFWAKKEHYDFIVRIGKHDFPCYRLVLMVELGIVRKRKDKLELRLPEDKISPETFDRIYRWMNDEQPLVKRTGIVSLLKAANYLQIRELTNQIWDCLSHERDFGEHHALQVALDAYCWKDKNLHILMLQRIHYFFLSFVASVEYLALPLSSLSHVLSSNEIRVNSEAEVFYAAIRWLNHEWPSRRIHVEEVMQMIRLTNLPNELLVKMEAPVGDVSVDRITRMTKVHERIKKAGFDQIVMLYNDGSQVYGQIYEVFQVRELQSRGFICHNLAPYHQPDPNSNGNAFSYADFLNYLGVLQSQPLDALQVLGRLP